MMLTIRKMLAHIICQTIEWEVNYFTAKEKCYFGFYFQVRVSKISSADSVSRSCSFCIRWYSPCCKPVKPGHYSVLGSRILRALFKSASKVKSKLPAYLTTPLIRVKGIAKNWFIWLHLWRASKEKSKLLPIWLHLYRGQRSKQRGYIFGDIFDARQR